jgi:2-keto-4-pentenoate hydratase
MAWLACKLDEFGANMQAGHVVLSGSFIKAIPLGAGATMVAIFDELGEITCSVR